MSEIVTKLLQNFYRSKKFYRFTFKSAIRIIFTLFWKDIWSVNDRNFCNGHQRGADRRQTMDVRSVIVVALQKQFTPNPAESLMQPAKTELCGKITLF